MKKSVIICLLLVLVIASCKKDDESNNNKEIKLGDYAGMVVNRYDTLIIGGYNQSVYFDLDVNNDSSSDFRITSEVFGSPGMGQHPLAKILSLNSACLFNGTFSDDTTYFHFQRDTFSGDNLSPVTITNTTSYSCRKIGSADLIVSIQSDAFTISYFSSDETILRSDDYRADTLKLNYDFVTDVNFPIVLIDTTIYNYVNHDNSCHSIPNDQLLYLGIKITGINDEKIGWIKICVVDNYKVLLLETAIQK